MPDVSMTGGYRTTAARPSGDRRPLVSVITAALDAAQTLPACLESVAAQTHPAVEHLVVDGGSSDGTLELLRAWDDRLAWWVSERDRGIYDAMNKGIAAARGDWLYFLGADDVLAAPDAIERCVPRLEPGAAVVYGDVRYTTGRRVRSRVGPRLLLHNTVHHQAAFYAARLFAAWRYDPALRLVADYELNLRLYLARERFVRTDVVVARCAEGGASRANVRAAFGETNLVRRRHLGTVANAALTLLFGAELALYVATGAGGAAGARKRGGP
jgi:putative colanic acid biosynthesis glycosyltransferase